MPQLPLYPKGNDGSLWLSATILVPSGKRVQITDLFARPREGLHVLAREWLGAVKRGPAWQRRCINENPEDYTPTAAYYANFALTYSGLAVGQFMEPACIRTVATVPYAVLRPQLSALGRRLVDGVRAPKWSYGP